MGLMQNNDPRVMRAQEEHAQKMFDNSLSRNTRINYRSRIYQYQQHGFKLPASPNDLVKFLNILAKDLKPTTIKCYLKAIKYWHKINNFIDPTDDGRVKQFYAGIRKTYGEPLKKAKPITLEDLIKIDKFLSDRDDFNSVRNKALFLIGFFAALRRSELVNIRFEHLTFSNKGLQILIPRSKTDQDGNGQVVTLPFMNSLCPVLALKAWLKKSKIKEGFIWPSVNVNGILGSERNIGGDMIYYLIKQIAIDCNLEHPEMYSGHSLRRGFATEASKKGVGVESLMKHGRWESVQTVMGYIEHANNFSENALNLFNK